MTIKSTAIPIAGRSGSGKFPMAGDLAFRPRLITNNAPRSAKMPFMVIEKPLKL
ncbi:protein of unknown function (plasmid) [Thermococcus nautili]|nr:protein of unknown function [Thermococcus nautili]